MIEALAFLAAAAAPRPGELRTFRDWIVGCDNGRVCQAVALLPEDGADGATLTVRRGPEAAATPVVWVTVRAEGMESPETLEIDGRRFPLVLDRETETPRVGDGAGAARMLGQATRIAALGPGGAGRVAVSTQGSAAALLYMDEQQRRLGTTSALVRRGPATQVPPPPALPTVRAAPGSPKRPARLSRQAIRAARGDQACAPGDPMQDRAPDYHRLDARHTLALVPLTCASGAYNFVSLALIVDDRGRARPALFDFGWGSAQERPDHHVWLADWDSRDRRLQTFFKGRGLGDCGNGESYAWDGARFRLVERSVMGECRGSTDYITTWRSKVR